MIYATELETLRARRAVVAAALAKATTADEYERLSEELESLEYEISALEALAEMDK